MTAGRRPPLTRAVWLILCYLSLLALIPFFARRRDPEIRWHALNGLLLFAALAGVGVVATLVGIAVPAFSCLYAVAMSIVSVLYVLVAVLALVQALEGRRLVIPGISRHADRLAGPR